VEAIAVMPFPDDAASVRATAANPAAFAVLYRRHVDDVYRYLLVRSGADEAEDVMAETFLAAFKAVGSYRGSGTVKAWLIGIARRKAIDAYRSRRPTEPIEAVSRIADPTRVEDLAIQRVEIAQVAGALARIGSERAEALRLRYFGGLSCAQIAPLMNRSEAAVKMLVHRGLRDLREELKERER
jgi:RNA polymerase sigma-70 factor (ECF subfamily)